jgi:tRNA A37 methylthiotransferase MiaB
MAAITNVTYCTIHLLEGFPEVMELNNVLKNAYEISQQNIKEIVLTGVNIEAAHENAQKTPTTFLSRYSTRLNT